MAILLNLVKHIRNNDNVLKNLVIYATCIRNTHMPSNFDKKKKTKKTLSMVPSKLIKMNGTADKTRGKTKRVRNSSNHHGINHIHERIFTQRELLGAVADKRVMKWQNLLSYTRIVEFWLRY